MEGVERMFERMVREHQHRVYAVGFALTGNRHDAEEVAQHTFLRAYRALSTYPAERIRDLKQSPWLHRIAVNVVRNRARGAKPRTAELNGSEPDDAPGPESRTLLRAEMDDLACRLGIAKPSSCGTCTRCHTKKSRKRWNSRSELSNPTCTAACNYLEERTM